MIDFSPCGGGGNSITLENFNLVHLSADDLVI